MILFNNLYEYLIIFKLKFWQKPKFSNDFAKVQNLSNKFFHYQWYDDPITVESKGIRYLKRELKLDAFF